MKFIFWTAAILIVYIYAGYPLVLTLLARRSRPPQYRNDHLPSVSLVMAAYNEEKVLQEKLDNSLALDYPKDRLEIVVASDGSTDQTNAIARTYASRGVILHEVEPRGGKTRALNQTIPHTRGEILVLSDANTMYHPDAIRKLVRHFADPSVGAVSGDVRLVNTAERHAESEGLYYQYERWLQSLESRTGSIIGADGAMYAVARTAFRPPSNMIILDDFVTSMTVARLGYRVVYDPEAVASEDGTLSSAEEFRRKIRIITGGIQALKLGEGLPRLQQPRLMFCYVSHKLLRWLVPFGLLAIMLASIALAAEPFYQFALSGQLLFYAAALWAALGLPKVRGGHVPYYFCLVNGAAFIGLWKGVWGTQTGVWQRTTRG